MAECAMSEKWWKHSKEEEYKKFNQLKSSDVNIIQEWMKKQPHLPALNDNQIIMFIRACDYSLERTKDTIDLNYTSRTRLSEYFTQRDLNRNTVATAMDYLKIGFLPVRQDGNIVVSCGINQPNYDKLYVDEFIKYLLMMFDVSHLEFGSSDGYIYIIDMAHVTLKLIFHVPLQALINTIKFWQYCSTYKIKGIHILNGGVAFEKLFQMLLPFIKPEVAAMISVHTNYEALRKVVDLKCVPSDYGGDAAPLNDLNCKSQEILKSHKEWFSEEEKQRVNEKKRLTPLSDDLGLQGSFRKLELD